MIWLILGVVLWWAAHLFKRVAPEARAKLGAERGKGIMAIPLVLSVVLMWWGYGAAAGSAFFWGRSSALVGVNNLLMVIAFYIYASGATPPGKPRNWVGTRLRHPQLVGFAVFAFAHLLPNGDLRSLVLFGGLLGWALVEIALINRQEPAWTAPAWGGQKSEIRIAGIGAAVFVVVALLHGWLGPWPFG